MRIKIFFSVLFFSLFLASCGSKDSFDVHSSASGLMPESFIPSDVSMVVSYSLLDEVQNSTFQGLMAKLGTENDVQQTAEETISNQLGDFGFDFGERYRVVFASKQSGEQTTAYTVSTLEDPLMIKKEMETLVAEGKLEVKKLSEVDAYVNEDQKFYALIHEDLLLISNDADALMKMLDEASSLWGSDQYQEAIDEFGAGHIFFALIFPQNLEGEIPVIPGFSVENLAGVLNREGIVVRAEESGFDFEAFAFANKDEAKKADIAFDEIPKEKAYLLSEVSSENLMIYAESYGLQQAVVQAKDLNEGLGAFETTVRNYLGMDLEDEILSFMDKGYVIALHKNGEAVFPGISLYFDISSDVENAEKFLEKIDGQLSGLLGILELALPGAVSKTVSEIAGTEFDTIKIDLTSLPRTTNSPLPTVITSSPITLSYGIIEDRLLITTYSSWSSDAPVSESDLYTKLSSSLDQEGEGLFLIDTQNIGDFAATLRALREQLGLSVGTFDVEKVLNGFLGGIATSDAETYEARLNGFLMTAE